MKETAERLMDLAEAHIRNAGYAGFSFRDLAAEIGIKSASVHHHFPKRDVEWRSVERLLSSAKSAVARPLEACCHKLAQARCQGGMPERCEKACQVTPQQSDVEGIHFLSRDGLAPIVRVAY